MAYPGERQGRAIAEAPVRVQQAGTIIESEGTLVGEASTLGLPVGRFPAAILAEWGGKERTWDRNRPDMNHGELTGVYYKERGGSLELLIIND